MLETINYNKIDPVI